MSHNAPARWIVSYDISEDHRRLQVMKLLQKYGVRLQYSVFAVPLSQARLASLFGDIALLIDPRTDDVRGYRVPLRTECHTLGPSMLPEDVFIDPDCQLAMPAERTLAHALG